jgi:hypothetical protein
MKVIILVAVLCGSALADTAVGLRAMKDGDYAVAFKEFAPVAKQGNALAEFYLGYLTETGSAFGAIPRKPRSGIFGGGTGTHDRSTLPRHDVRGR